MSKPKVVLSDPDWDEDTMKRFAPAGDTVLKALDNGGICEISHDPLHPGFFTIWGGDGSGSRFCGCAVLSAQQLLQLIRELQVLVMSPHPSRNGRP